MAPLVGLNAGVKLCCNLWEHLGGAFGCGLLAGHEGPHALQDLPSRRSTASAARAAAVVQPRKRPLACRPAGNAGARSAKAPGSADSFSGPGGGGEQLLKGLESTNPGHLLLASRSASASPSDLLASDSASDAATTPGQGPSSGGECLPCDPLPPAHESALGEGRMPAAGVTAGMLYA